MDAPRKVVLITGTSRGIGFHLAKRFLSEGYSVIGLSRSRTDIEDERFEHFEADLSNWNFAHQLAEEWKDSPISGFIHNAGIHGPLGPFETNPLARWVDTFAVNLFSGVALAQSLIPTLRKTKGFIIFLSGGGSAYAKPNFSAYSVSKTAVVRMAENLAEELRPEIKVYCVAPGPNRTALLQKAMEAGDAVREDAVVDFSAPENLCLFLAQNHDPRYSGKFIHVKDDYRNWNERHFAEANYTLRRAKVS